MRTALVIAMVLAATSAQAVEPKPPFSLFTELKSLCIDTKGDPQAMAAASQARHYRQIGPDDYGLGDRVQTVNMVIRKSNVMELDDLGAVQATGCLILVRPGRESDVEDVFRWLGLGKAPMRQRFSLMFSEGATESRTLLNRNIIGQQDALRRGTLRMIGLERLPGAVRVQYFVVKPAPLS